LLHKQTHLQGSRAEHIDNNEEPLKVLEETDAMKSFPEDTRPKELTTTENKLSSSQNICFEHDVLKDVVMVKGKGPRQIDYETVRGEGGVLKEIVVSRKCAEAVLRGAQVHIARHSCALTIKIPGFQFVHILLVCSIHLL
jgi:hypothetical protein